MGEMSESIIRAPSRPQSLIYFWRGAARPSGRLEVRWQKNLTARSKAFDIHLAA